MSWHELHARRGRYELAASDMTCPEQTIVIDGPIPDRVDPRDITGLAQRSRTKPSATRRCRPGRYGTIGEVVAYLQEPIIGHLNTASDTSSTSSGNNPRFVSLSSTKYADANYQIGEGGTYPALIETYCIC